jgi:pimeloyl-ACP methyl ester carboxylesterase
MATQKSSTLGVFKTAPMGIVLFLILIGGFGLPTVSGENVAVSNIRVSDVTHRIVTISWETSTEATAQVIYGLTSQYGHSAGASGLTTDHRVILADLDPETTYHFRVVSVAASGEIGVSEDLVFTTTAVPKVPTAFPPDFQSPVDASTRLPMPGFGGGPGVLYHDPVIFVHGNNESAKYWLGLSHAIPRLFGRFFSPEPIPGGGDVQPENVIERFIVVGYTPAELWAFSYLGEDGLNNGRDVIGSSVGHSHVANAPDVGAFVQAVLAYTGAERVDIVAHSLGVTLVREWIRQELEAGTDVLSRLDAIVLIAGANHGIHFCGFPFLRGTEPGFLITLCTEVGHADTPFLTALNANETPQTEGRPRYLTLLAVGPSEDFAFPSDGVDSLNRMVNFRLSPVLEGAVNVGLAFELPPDPRFPVVIPTNPPLEIGDPRAHYLLGVSKQSLDIFLPFVNNPRQ